MEATVMKLSWNPTDRSACGEKYKMRRAATSNAFSALLRLKNIKPAKENPTITADRTTDGEAPVKKTNAAMQHSVMASRHLRAPK